MVKYALKIFGKNLQLMLDISKEHRTVIIFVFCLAIRYTIAKYSGLICFLQEEMQGCRRKNK